MNVIVWAIVFAIVAVLGVMGAVDQQAAEAEQEAYCENVKAGIWPDYRDLVKTGNCK